MKLFWFKLVQIGSISKRWKKNGDMWMNFLKKQYLCRGKAVEGGISFAADQVNV